VLPFLIHDSFLLQYEKHSKKNRWLTHYYFKSNSVSVAFLTLWNSSELTLNQPTTLNQLQGRSFFKTSLFFTSSKVLVPKKLKPGGRVSFIVRYQQAEKGVLESICFEMDHAIWSSNGSHFIRT
jgi:hypothetical protein